MSKKSGGVDTSIQIDIMVGSFQTSVLKEKLSTIINVW